MTDVRDQIEFAVRKVAARKAAERRIADALRKLELRERLEDQQNCRDRLKDDDHDKGGD